VGLAVGPPAVPRVRLWSEIDATRLMSDGLAPPDARPRRHGLRPKAP
jgi:hypothetical protein